LIDIHKAVDKVHQDQGALAPDAAGPAQALVSVNGVFVHGQLNPRGSVRMVLIEPWPLCFM
jgi:hypothetical protein